MLLCRSPLHVWRYLARRRREASEHEDRNIFISRLTVSLSYRIPGISLRLRLGLHCLNHSLARKLEIVFVRSNQIEAWVSVQGGNSQHRARSTQ